VASKLEGFVFGERLRIVLCCRIPHTSEGLARRLSRRRAPRGGGVGGQDDRQHWLGETERGKPARRKVYVDAKGDPLIPLLLEKKVSKRGKLS